MSKLTAEDKKLLARMKEIRELISEFGLTLSGFDPGISAYLKDRPEVRGNGYWGEAIRFDHNEWKWLEPLLHELRMRRKVQTTDVERLLEWLHNPKRKPANTAFTDGQERQIAYWMEIALALNDRKKGK